MVNEHSPLATFQSLSFPSAPAVASRVESGLNLPSVIFKEWGVQLVESFLTRKIDDLHRAPVSRTVVAHRDQSVVRTELQMTDAMGHLDTHDRIGGVLEVSDLQFPPISYGKELAVGTEGDSIGVQLQVREIPTCHGIQQTQAPAAVSRRHAFPSGLIVDLGNSRGP